MTDKPTAPAKPTTGAKPGMAMPLGASQSKDPWDMPDYDLEFRTMFPVLTRALEDKDDREEKCRQLARLGAAMGRVCR